MTKKLRELRESGRGRDGGWKRGSRARSRPAGGREGSGHAEEDDLLAGGERVDGDLLQLVALVEPPELAVGEGVADGDRSHGRAGGMGCRRGLGCGAVAGVVTGWWAADDGLVGYICGRCAGPSCERINLGESDAVCEASRPGPGKLDFFPQLFYSEGRQTETSRRLNFRRKRHDFFFDEVLRRKKKT